MRRSFFALAATGLATVLLSATSAQAVTSTQGFTATSTTNSNGSQYTLTGFTSTQGQTGGFASPTAYPQTDLGTVTFDAASTTGDLSFGNTSFGTFTSTSVTVNYNGTNGAVFYFLGNWAPGTVNPVSSVPAAGEASVVVSISSAGGTLSGAATLSIPPASVPEPSSVVLGLTSLALGGLAHGLRRRRASK